MKRRRLNIKFVCILLGVLAVIGVGGHFLHGFQVRQNATVFFEQAERALKAEPPDMQVAVDYLGRYLSLVPGDTIARGKYGVALAHEKVATSPRALFRAYGALEDAVRRDPEHDAIRRRLVQVAMNPWLGRFTDAAHHLKYLLEKNEKEKKKDGELEGLLGQCQEQNGEYKQARKSLQDAIANAEKVVDNYVRLAYLLRQRGAKLIQGKETVEALQKQADQFMAKMIEKNDRSVLAYLTRARYVREFATPDKLAEAVKSAERDIRKAQILAPQDAEVILAVAEVARDNKKPAEARGLLNEAVGDEKTPGRHHKDWRMYQALARLEILEGQPQAALKPLRNGLKLLPKQLDLLWNLAHLLIQQGQQERGEKRTAYKDEATDLIERLRVQGFPAAHLEYLNARIDVGAEQWLAAARRLERAYPQLLSRNSQQQDWFSLNLAQESNLLLGLCYERLGDPDRAASAYVRVVGRNPQSIPGRLGKARMQWAMNHLDAARDEYQQLLLLPNAPGGAWIELAQLQIVRNLNKKQPDWSEVQPILDAASKLVPPPAEVALLRAEVLAAQKDFSQARKVLTQDHADAKQRPVENWVGLASLEERQGKSGAALAVLDEAEKQLGDKPELRLARARYWARHSGKKALAVLAKLAQNFGDMKVADRQRVIRGVATAYQQLNEGKEAERLWAEVAREQKNDLGSRLMQFHLAMQRGDAEAMTRLMEQLKGIEGEDGTLWRYAKACGLVLQAERTKDKVSWKSLQPSLAQAEDELNTVAKRRSSWPRVWLVQASISELRGNPDAALARYQRAVALGDRNPQAIRRAVQLLTERKRYPEAEQLLETLRQQQTTLGDLDRVAAQLSLYRQDHQKAIELAQKAVSAKSKDYKDHIWLGRILAAAGQTEEAEASFRAAVALANRVPDGWVAYVQYLVATGNKKKAEAIVQEAAKNLPKAVADLPLAQCYLMLGNVERAGALYNDALAAQPEDVSVLRSAALFYWSQKQIAKAKEHFRQIIKLPSSKPEDVDWAKRAQALLLASGGNYQQQQQALATLGPVEGVEQGDAPRTPSAADERARLAILATQPSLRQRRQAVAILENLRRRQALDAGEQFLLAQLYDAVGEKDKAREQFMSLATTAEDQLERNPRRKAQLQQAYCTYLAHAGQLALRSKRLSEAQLCLAKMEKHEPETLRTLSLKAQVLARSGQAEQAVAPLQALARKDEKQLRSVAVVLEQIGQHAAAQELYEKYVAASKRPEDALILVTFFGRRNLPEKALGLCEKAWQHCPPEAVGRAAMTVVYTAGKATEAQREQVAKWLEDALARNPKKAELLEELAAVRRLQGRYRDAIALYNRMLELNEGDAVILNNLAWLHALAEKNGAEALKFIQRAIDVRGPVAGSLDTRGVVYLTLGQSKDAIQDLEEAIADTPTAHLCFHLAQAQYQASNRNAAVRALQQAKTLGLTEQTVDPLEIPAYRQLVAALDRK